MIECYIFYFHMLHHFTFNVKHVGLLKMLHALAYFDVYICKIKFQVSSMFIYLKQSSRLLFHEPSCVSFSFIMYI